MCQGAAFLANNVKALYGKKTNSHSNACEELKIDGDNFRKFEYLWWDKTIKQVHYDQVAESILVNIDENKARKLVEQSVKKNFNTQDKLAKWLKEVPDEWNKLLDSKFKGLAKKVNPKLIIYQDKIAKFKKEKIEKYNPYQATKLPKIEELRKYKLDQVRNQVWDQVGDQVKDQVWDQVWDQVKDQVWDQVRNQVWDQVWDQVWITSYWAVKVVLGLPIKHWFFDFLKLGIMVVFVKGKVKVFGKGGKYLGEYSEKEFK